MNADATLSANSDPYLALGVRPFINCCSVRTLHGGSLMLPEVRQAVAAAARQFVNLDELMEAAGQRIAELTGAEWGMVTCGSAAALSLGTAACVAGNDPVRMLRLPFTDGIPNRVAMISGQRFAYDQAVRMVGTHIVECGDAAALAAALDTGLVAMVCVLGKQAVKGPLLIEEIVALARARQVPVMVDAASEHLERPSPWLASGADLVIYSGGKFLRGPQTSGLLLGSKPLVQAAWRNAAPHQAFGRPMKVSKEDVVGVIAALEHWFTERDAGAEEQRWRNDLDEIAHAVGQHDGITCDIIAPEGMDRVPSLHITWRPEQVAVTSLQLRQALLDGTPRIMLDDTHATAHAIWIEPFNLQPGEAREVGAAIARALRPVRRAGHDAGAAPAVDVSGAWDVTVDFLKGRRIHRMVLEQDGASLSGRQDSEQFSGGVAGCVAATAIELTFDAEYEGSTIFFSFAGTAAPSLMTGTVLFGAVNGTSGGEFNRRQHGAGTWTAHRAPPL
jgi:D-glucosaminate-6-phosphate ammonia-lyase